MRVVCLLIAAAGAWIAWQSSVWGLQDFPRVLDQLSGLGGDQRRVAIEAPVAAIRLIGVVMLGVGLLRALELPRSRDVER